MVDLRKLVALDMALHGTRFILAEFAFGMLVLPVIGLFSIRSVPSGSTGVGWGEILGLWLLGVAVNYIPMFIYAVLIVRRGTVEEESASELSQVRRYSLQQVVVLVPLLVVILALVQEARR